jgi:hypothetical protein
MKEAVAMAAEEETVAVAAWAMTLTCGRWQGSGPSAKDVSSLACSATMLSCKGA